MPTPIPAGMRLGLVQPLDTVAAFERRKLLQPSFRWQDVFQEEHADAFAVAGVTRLDVLQVFYDELVATEKAGGDLRAFSKSIQPKLAEKGFWGDVEVKDPETGETRVTTFDQRRLQLIFDVNTREAAAAGRWDRIDRNKATKPFIVYRTMGDERVRASHRPWDLLVLPVDDPFWETHFPPNGWRCRCYAFAADEKDLARLEAAGFKLQREAPKVDWLPYVNPRSGEVVPVPRGIDPGFAYNPGKERSAALYEQALRKATEAQPLAGAVAVAQASTANPQMLAQTVARFGKFVDSVMGSSVPARSAFYVGAIRPPAVRAIEAQGIELDSSALAVTDDGVRHTLRPGKVADGVAIDPQVYKQLPQLLADASALLLERDTNALLYVLDVQLQDRVAKAVVRLAEPVKLRTSPDGRRQRFTANVVRTVTVMNPQALHDMVRYQVLWGSL